MTWEIRYRSSVEKDVARLPPDVRRRVLLAIASLAENQFPPGCRKLKGAEKRYQLRIAASYRLVYSVFKEDRLIEIEFIGHRKDAFRLF
ncbi:MAG TPA: type II toxin-antitoxin system RelE/ParE family toxin [Terriglobia bacterium]|nr:type II toxin-antitoxin system RelE/ParE family toxin [Terriglobia bacterium]